MIERIGLEAEAAALAKLKRAYQSAKTRWEVFFRLLKDGPVYTEFAVNEGTLREAEEGLRNRMERRYAEDRNLNPAPGLRILIEPEIFFNEREAIRWAVENGRLDVLQINPIAYRTLAIRGIAPAEIHSHATAHIDANLEELYPEET